MPPGRPDAALCTLTMCTVVIAYRMHADYPVLVAANRDEFDDRPWSGPELLQREPRAVGGRDLRAGGTWMGATARGFVAALTNQRSYGDPVQAPRSRGEIVLHALRAPSTNAFRHWLSGLDCSRYNPFNLLFGDAAGLFVAYARRAPPSLRIEPVPKGMSVLPNDYLDSPAFPKVRRAKALFPARIAGREWPDLWPRLVPVIADHALPENYPEMPGDRLAPATRRGLHALCVRVRRYGTQSASIVAAGEEKIAHYLFAPGPPCTTAFVDHTSMFESF